MLRPLLAFAGLATALLTLPFAPQREQDSALTPSLSPTLVPFAIDGARELGVVDTALLIANVSEDSAPLVIEGLRVFSHGDLLDDRALEVELVADRRFAELQALVERMPEELSHRRGERRFADPRAPQVAHAELAEAWQRIDALAARLREDYGTGQAQPFVEVHFPLALELVFYPEDPAGTVREVTLEVTWRRGLGASQRTQVGTTIRRLAPLLPAPDSLALDLGSVTLHAGDLHVHSCHGEASNACAPSSDCTAESFQTSGSFTYGQLKTQYQALGLDWFTGTDHSYCINDDSEYQSIVSELAVLNDATFLAPADLEVSSEEEGSQQGSDLADLLCLLGPEQNHMGAHGISSRIPGGDDGFLGFCNGLFSDALDTFSNNVASVRAQGGFPIANHPADSSFAWNSFAALTGIEADALHGIEIWNGASQSGQGEGVDAWVRWLLAGRILYAYSGSDTHDAAFAFGANHAVFFDEPFTIPNLQDILKRGRLFLSDGHVLILAIDLNGSELVMGQLQSLAPAQPASTLNISVHYNFGTDSSTISVFRGAVGDAAESLLCTSGPLTGQGVFTCTDTLDPAARSWYRAYSESSAGAPTAYTNPIFFLPSTRAASVYGSGLGGANIATLSSPSSPAIGSLFRFEASGFAATTAQAVLALSRTQVPNGLPLAGGFLLAAPPFELLASMPLTGGAGAIDEEIPFEVSLVGIDFFAQAAAPDPSQIANLAFSNGLALTIANILE